MPWVAPLLYGTVLIAGLYHGLAHLSWAQAVSPRMAAFLGGLALLIALEWLSQRFAAPAILPLAARLCLIAGVAALDISGMARILLVLVPFTAYFAFGRSAALALTGVCLAVVLGLYAVSDPEWYSDPEYVSDLLMLLIGLVLALSMAAVATGEQQGRARLEGVLRELEHSHARLTEYAAQVAELSAATERNRLARDIHDSLGHHLTVIAILLEKASAFRDRDPAAAEQAVTDARRSAGLALDDVRTSVRTLRDRTGPFSLPSALADLVRQGGGGNPQVRLEVSGEDSHGYDRTTLTALYRAAQEGLTNARRHADALQVSLSLRFAEDGVRLVVADDGRGFPPGGTEGFGLLGLRERMRLVGGTVGIDSSPELGTRITVDVQRAPLPAVQGAIPGAGR